MRFTVVPWERDLGVLRVDEEPGENLDFDDALTGVEEFLETSRWFLTSENQTRQPGIGDRRAFEFEVVMITAIDAMGEAVKDLS